ncbi:MAG: HAMP domain-containing sensor histidine kinase [Polyangiaceae bacterium]|jgi:signal transduction histidine kinase
MLGDFVNENREEILAQARARVAKRSIPAPTDVEMSHGLPMFLEQLRTALERSASKKSVDHEEIQLSAARHGHDLFSRGVTVAQVVHDYGDICQVITGLSFARKKAIPPEDFQTLNLCLDDAIAGAVTAYAQLRERAIADEGTARLGYLAHEMRNALNVSILAFSSIKRGAAPIGGSTGGLLERSHARLQNLIDRSLAEVRLDVGLDRLERVPVCELIEEVEIGASMVAQAQGRKVTTAEVDPSIIVEADRQILAAALANLVQNAIKFTRAGTTIEVRAVTTTDRVLIEVEDECGGLPRGKAENLLRPFIQQGTDRTGLGLGLAICVKAVKAMAGELHVRDLPGKGCVFTIDLPKQAPPPAALRG